MTCRRKENFAGFDAYKKAIALADVVILATPPGFRPIHFEEAVKQGKHVFMEKPVATDPAGIQKSIGRRGNRKAKKIKCGSWACNAITRILTVNYLNEKISSAILLPPRRGGTTMVYG